MKTNPERFQEIAVAFPQLIEIIKKLNEANIPYNIGGSATLYVQGNSRFPHDIDVMFTPQAHIEANELLGLEMEHIERPYVSMDKSSPFEDGSVDFLSRYASISGDRSFYTDPIEVVRVQYEDMAINLVPSEKIAVFKLISRREHHNDLNDFYEIFNRQDFDKKLFWEIADSLDASGLVTHLLTAPNQQVQ